MSRRKMTEEEKQAAKEKKKIKLLQESYKRELRDLRKYRIPEPAYLHAVGDRVKYGSWDWTAVLEILDGGKIYKCFSVTKHTKRNVPNETVGKIHYLPWFDTGIYKTEYPERVEEDEEVHIQFTQRDIIGILRFMYNQYGIDLSPDYQRGNVWSIDQKTALIDSIFKNVDIGKFCVIKRRWGSNPSVPETPFMYEMLDGKQRLTAIWEFYTGRFKYKDLYYYEMHPRDRHHLKHYSISVGETNPLTDEQKYRYFLKLNTTGTPVSEKHMNRVRQLWLKKKTKN